MADQAPSGKQKHKHPGGSGAVLGVRVMRNSGVQAITLVVGNVMQLVSTLVVASFLGPSELARFGLLMFLAGLVTQLTSLLCKPGTIRRTFGGGDDEDDDDDDDDETSSSPPRTLGTGLAFAVVLGFVAAEQHVGHRFAQQEDQAGGDEQDENLVALAGLLSGALLVFKICDITLWLERRPTAFLICDTARPLLGLVVLTAFLAAEHHREDREDADQGEVGEQLTARGRLAVLLLERVIGGRLAHRAHPHPEALGEEGDHEAKPRGEVVDAQLLVVDEPREDEDVGVLDQPERHDDRRPIPAALDDLADLLEIERRLVAAGQQHQPDDSRRRRTCAGSCPACRAAT